MATCVFNGINLDKFVDSEDTKFYRVEDEKISLNEFMKTSSISQERIDKLIEKLYPTVVEAKEIINETEIQQPTNISEIYPKKTFDEMMRDIQLSRQRSLMIKRRQNISNWYRYHKQDIDDMFFRAYNEFNHYNVVFTRNKQIMYNHFVEHLYDKFA